MDVSQGSSAKVRIRHTLSYLWSSTLLGSGVLLAVCGGLLWVGIAVNPSASDKVLLAFVAALFVSAGIALGVAGGRRLKLLKLAASSGTPSKPAAWARRLLETPSEFAILDTETTGVDEEAEVVQIAVIDTAGRELFKSFVRPLHRRRMPSAAKQVHGISMSDLKNAPSWPEISEALRAATAGRTIISYNAAFDSRLVRQTARINGGAVPSSPWECAMLAYAEFVGEWDAKYGHFKWHKLPNGDHSALGDCRATLELVRRIASG